MTRHLGTSGWNGEKDHGHHLMSLLVPTGEKYPSMTEHSSRRLPLHGVRLPEVTRTHFDISRHFDRMFQGKGSNCTAVSDSSCPHTTRPSGRPIQLLSMRSFSQENETAERVRTNPKMQGVCGANASGTRKRLDVVTQPESYCRRRLAHHGRITARQVADDQLTAQPRKPPSLYECNPQWPCLQQSLIALISIKHLPTN